ncbi:mobile element protein [Halalkalibacter hemicellulosilyticusJCM 9152]|uniref:Mobile element protein n=2 Tax=Halalkalibacter TaxID=2893056 RepID=W4QGK6_9BACI|nr:mobile element protein [Halalkalibacter hemicellulosilyticusJCM 9152]
MHHNTIIPGLEGVIITNSEVVEGIWKLSVEVPKCRQKCPCCGNRTNRVHDYRIQKIKHLKVFERMTIMYYRRRRYSCKCGKRFSEKTSFIERYQRHSVEWNQAVALRVVKGKTFKETAEIFGTSSSTIMRRFDTMAAPQLKEVRELPPVIAIDEYKGDTSEGKFQVIIADPVNRQPLDILPNRKMETVKNYLHKKGGKVEVVVMDMSNSFKSAVTKALGKPVIVADRFHYCRYIYWALERVRRSVQNEFDDYNRKKCKRMKHVFYKKKENLSEVQRWYLDRYLSMSDELCEAYDLKELFCEWLEKAKEIGSSNISYVKETLYEFYRKVEASNIDAFKSAIQTFRNWQPEIFNSFAFGYTNGFIEGLNNQTKVFKRNAFGFKRYDRFRMRILLHHQWKHIPAHIG